MNVEELKKFIQIKRKHKIKLILSVFLMIAVVFCAACQTEKTAKSDTPPGLFVVKSPADGIITKILANEGARVEKDAGIVEIEIISEVQTVPVDEKPKKNVGADLEQTKRQIENAEQEVKRTSVEVERMQSLVSDNSAPQAQLDAARADFQKAQKQLENLEEKRRKQETKNLITETKELDENISNTIQQKNIVVARNPAAGILKVINARIGQKVKKGQTIATVSTN